MVVRWILKHQILLQLLPAMVRRAGTPQPRAQRHFFIATLIVLESFSIPVLPEGVAVVASRSGLTGAISWKRGQSPPGTAAEQRESGPTSRTLAGSTSEAKGIARGDAKCLLSFLWGPEFANVIVFPEI